MMFDGVVLLLNGKPVHIHNVTEDRYVNYRDLLAKNMGVVSIEDANLEWSCLNTGNININGEVGFFHRLPVRRYKQGLHRDNIAIYPEIRGELYNEIRALSSYAVGTCVLNIYPSFEKALIRVSKNKKEVAFDRQFSVTRDGLLRYKREDVGTINLMNGKAHFKKEKFYLRSLLGVRHESA